ncbi:MAG TPA: transketolase [Anaerolineae bacterium]|nr:transketolase [Anaerolineae bacterium]
MTSTELDQLCVNTIRTLSIDAVQRANSGHPGLPLGAAPVGYVLFTRIMRYNPADPKWFNRDRLVLSAGHGSMLLYSLLHLTGYDLPLSELQNFRQWGSMTPGHPEYGLAPGVETTTGPLGQGFGNGVGMALAEAHLAARYNRPSYNMIDHTTYGIVSDGDLMEGVASEAASLAGHWRLGKLIYLYDDNRISLAGSTNITFTEDVGRRFEAYGWHVQRVGDANDLAAIESAIRAAQAARDRPSLIMVRSTIGYGSPNKQNTFEVHGSPLGLEEVKLTKQNLGWPVDPPFYIPGEALEHFRAAIDRGRSAQSEWQAKWDAYAREYPELASELQTAIKGDLPAGWDADVPSFSPSDTRGDATSAGKPIATRVASGRVLNAIAAKIPTLIGGSADLNPSTNTALKGMGDFMHPDTPLDGAQGLVGGGVSYAGRNIAFGVREHAMAGIATGMALHGGLIPFAATFLQFSDYMRPAIRLAALSESHVIYVFTHDSVLLGEDGPTHQPVEHYAALRAIPNLLFIRPADPNETAVAWKVAVEHKHGPVALALTRQVVPALDRSKMASAEGLRHGGYVLIDAGGKPDVILIGTGSEVQLCVGAVEELARRGIKARVVSLPCWELFDAQPQDYRDSVLDPMVRRRLAVEIGVAQGWHKYVTEHGDVLSLERFGASAPYQVIAKKLGFTVENVVERAMRLVNR